jgi:hypothetical protein
MLLVGCLGVVYMGGQPILRLSQYIENRTSRQTVAEPLFTNWQLHF